MTKSTYLELQSQLDHEPSNAMAFVTVCGNAAFLAAGVWLMQQPSWVAFAASQVVLAIAFFQAFAILHDCGHGSFCADRRVELLVGHWCSLFCFQPFYSWKYIHQEHHAFAGTPDKDPSLRTLHRWRRTGHVPTLARFAWRSWVPLVGAAQHLVYWLYPLVLRKRGERRKVARCLASVLFSLLGYAAIASAAIAGLVETVNVLPAILLYLLLAELVNLPHHMDLPSSPRPLRLWEQWRVSRSCYYPRIVSEIGVLNFNFHTEHHLFPKLPWYRLRSARSLVKRALSTSYNESVGITWNLENRTRPLEEVALVGSSESDLRTTASV
jgi:omega-6 fatty acid desaturase (delta-12 desaturase)